MPYDVMHTLYAVAQATPMAALMTFSTCMAGYASKTTLEHFKIENLVYHRVDQPADRLRNRVLRPEHTIKPNVDSNMGRNGYITWHTWKLSKIVANKITKKQITTTA